MSSTFKYGMYRVLHTVPLCKINYMYIKLKIERFVFSVNHLTL